MTPSGASWITSVVSEDDGQSRETGAADGQRRLIPGRDSRDRWSRPVDPCGKDENQGSGVLRSMKRMDFRS